MRGAADDAQGGGVVAELFAGVPIPRGSVPQLRLMAALHELVLEGAAPELAEWYPSAGGTRRDLQRVWPVAERTLRGHAEVVATRLPRTMQTNEPGRSTVMFGVLLSLARPGRPIRLLEIGASAGLNLIADRYGYDQEGAVYGDPASPLRFERPWRPAPPLHLAAAQSALAISARAGCDPSPLAADDPVDRRRLQSYIWPDELPRLQRLRAALQVAAADPPPVTAATGRDWLPGALARRRHGELTVVWHSVMRQYVGDEEWQATLDTAASAARADPDRPIAWVGMEPTTERTLGCVVTMRWPPCTDTVRLASCDDHGPPVAWEGRPRRQR